MLLVASVLTASCNRAPPEPAAATDVWIGPSATAPAPMHAANEATSTAPVGPCVREMASSAPPAVPTAPRGLCPKDPKPNSTLTTLTTEVGATSLEVELAQTSDESERGLMYRMKMPENHGMLFNLHTTSDHEFWMHNTCIPLDMLYIDESGRIVGILENVPVLNDEPRSIGCPSRWVLEVNAGWSRRNGVHAGDKVRLPAD